MSCLSGIMEPEGVDIITDLKSFTYSQSTELEICDLPKVVEETVKVLSYDLEHAIEVDIQLGELSKFMAHNGLMQQVLTNLIKNAAQALVEAKTPAAKISIHAAQKGDSIYIIVLDNGPGIPEDAREKIFEPFYTTKDVGKGTGLGLSISQTIMQAHKGSLTYTREGDETVFSITMPVARVDEVRKVG